MRWTHMAWIVALAAAGCDSSGGPIDAEIRDDAPNDAGIDADLRCAACTADQICVQKFNGTCGEFALECQPRNPACTGTACTNECNFWQCGWGMDGGILTCFASPCAGANPNALHCYGP